MRTETATMPATPPAYRAAMLHALRRFINSRPGFEPANYHTAAAFRADSRRALAAGWRVEPAIAYLSRINAEIKARGGA